ncbi:MAG: hypothetical protein ABW189_07265 [Rickettsiales bacterium]
MTTRLVPSIVVRFFPSLVSPEQRFAYAAERFAEAYLSFLRLVDPEKRHFSDDRLEKLLEKAMTERVKYINSPSYMQADWCLSSLYDTDRLLNELSIASSDERKAALRTLELLRRETETQFSNLYGENIEGNRTYLDTQLQILAYQWKMPDILFGSEGLLKKLIDDTHENSANFGLLKQALQYHLNYVA